MAVRRYRPINYPTTVTETNDLTAAVTWANVPDANITESSVTQHAAAIGTAGGFLTNVVEDTTPQLGGNLDALGYNIDNVGTFTIQDATGADTVTFSHDGTSLNIDPVGTTRIEVNQGGTLTSMRFHDGADLDFLDSGKLFLRDVSNNYCSVHVVGGSIQYGSSGVTNMSFINMGSIWYRDGATLRILDSTDTDYAEFQHDGIDFNTTFTNTTDWNITGITAIQAGAVDADFDAITATSYGGITEANLVDKSAAETITGAWALPSTATIDSITATNLLDKSAAESISGAYTFSGAGVFSTSLNAVPLARSVTATGNTASTDYGIVIRFTSGSAQTFTLDGDPPTNAVVLLDNSAGAAWTIAASTSLIWAKDASTGNRTLADDGVAVAVHRGSGTWIINGSDLLT